MDLFFLDMILWSSAQKRQKLHIIIFNSKQGKTKVPYHRSRTKVKQLSWREIEIHANHHHCMLRKIPKHCHCLLMHMLICYLQGMLRTMSKCHHWCLWKTGRVIVVNTYQQIGHGIIVNACRDEIVINNSFTIFTKLSLSKFVFSFYIKGV